MDTSPEYIKMCDWPKIQKEWKPKEGDFFTFCGEPKIIKDYEIWALEKRELSDIEEWNEIIKTMGGHFVDHFLEARECFVFLPRQDQIQGMMTTISKFWKNIPPFFYNERLFFWNRQHKIQGDKTSMEQLWLAFYMYEKHGKVWSGKEWIDGK